MGRQIVDPATDTERMAVVETLARRLSRSIGDWVATVPGGAPMSFALAVREGIVRV